jgi:signal transduction histidine kinase
LNPKQRFSKKLLPKMALLCGAGSLLLGAVVIIGWFTGNRTLVKVMPSFVPMQFNTALGFLLCGAGLIAVQIRHPKLSSLASGMAGAIGLLTLFQYVFGADPAPQCELIFTDNGIGFESKYSEQVFQPFRRLNGRSDYPGGGMGFAICRRIAKRHDGTITFRERT